MRVLIIATLLAAVMPLHAATYIVPPDREMIAAAQAIVVGTVTDMACRRTDTGLIETVSTVLVEERLHGDIESATIRVALLGGRLGEEWLEVSGSPSFTPGERVLLFLTRNRRGDWTTYALALGVFRFQRQPDGTEVLSRGAEEIVGWTGDGAPHVERPRSKRAFLQYIRAVLGHRTPAADYFVAERVPAPVIQPNATFTSGSYTTLLFNETVLPARRTGAGLTVAWQIFGAVPGLDLQQAVDFGTAAWNDASPLIHYSRSSLPASEATLGDAAESRVIANDPYGVADGTCCKGILAVTYSTGSDRHSFNGETFRTIGHSDIVVNDGMSSANFNQHDFDITMTHELGHTLGLRHSNKTRDNNAACAPPLDCCIHDLDNGSCLAVMNHALIAGLTGLQYWDRNAVHCLYEASCTPPCNPISITQQPQSRTIPVGAPTSLLVGASGTPPLTRQWYIGEAGDTSRPTGNGEWQLQILPAVTTSYWVRVSSPCGNSVDSVTAVITVDSCSDIVLHSATATNTPDGQVILVADASGGNVNLRYTWFRGDVPGVGGTVISNNRLTTVTVTERTAFWVSVRSSCGKSLVSELVFAAPCGLPSIVKQPQDQTVPSGSTAALSVGLSPAGGTVTWYRGLPGDKSNSVGSGAAVIVGPLAATTTFWAAIANACGEIPTRAVTINVSAEQCMRPDIAEDPASTTIFSGGDVTLSVSAGGSQPLSFQWYEGGAGVTTTPVGSDSATFTSPLLLHDTTYWVRVTNGCGSADSAVAAIRVVPGRRRAARP